MDIGDWLDRAGIVYRSSADSKRQALSVVADAAAKALKLKASDIFDALMDREAQGVYRGWEGRRCSPCPT